MAQYIFLGSHTAISGPGYEYTLTRFGEACELPEAAAHNHAAHGARILPAADFERIGFTKEELEINSDLLAHDDTADEEFLVKRKAAFDAADHFRAEASAASA
jgi:hypothetical protein